MDRVSAALKAKFQGTRGFTYYSTGAGRTVTMATAESWIRRTWLDVEARGGRVVQVYITPEDD